MKQLYKQYYTFKNRLIIVGFGGIGQAVLPLILRHIDISPEQITIVCNNESAHSVAQEYNISFHLFTLTPENYESFLLTVVKENDFLLNLTVDVSSIDLIQFCDKYKVLYLDTAIECWESEIGDESIADKRTNYALRKAVINSKTGGPTAVITHGANPGLVSHFFKQALVNLAIDLNIEHGELKNATDWANLARTLGIQCIHTAEFDSQISSQAKERGEFVNTWSVEGFIVEGLQPAEIGWGTHERHWPVYAKTHEDGSNSAIYLDKPSASVKVRTWTPIAGAFHGYLITHAEVISLAEFLTLQEGSMVYYRPTVCYAYSPCPDAILSLHELEGNNWIKQPRQRLIIDNISQGLDELGALLLGHSKGAYWFGSQLNIHEARALAPHNNATTLQVAAGVLGGIVWALKNPNQGIVEPEMMDYQMILDIARPYLGQLKGYYSDWNPLQNREHLHMDTLDANDPWQFINMLVSR